jgi:heme-degrading monooxygenase HmoA
MIAETPQPPYYAVIFTSIRTEVEDGYTDIAERMLELAQKQVGFLGYESSREEIGITVSYWRDQDSIRNWKNNIEHTLAREKGRSDWYKAFKTRIARVEREYGFLKEDFY